LCGAGILAPLDIPATLYSKYKWIDPKAGNIPRNHYLIDMFDYDLPRNFVVHQSLANGEFPWWEPYTEGGRPLAAGFECRSRSASLAANIVRISNAISGKRPLRGRASHGERLMRILIGAGAALLFASVACSPPVNVDRVDLRTAYDGLNRTALSSDQLSEATRTVLRRAALFEVFNYRPDDAITALRAQAIVTGMRWPDLYALAELYYYVGRRTKSKAMLLASALYAYAVLFPAGDADRPSPYSGQFLHAADFYNLALTQVLSGAGAEGVAKLQSGRYAVPFGVVDVAIDQASLTFAGRTMTSFVPTMNLEVQGFQNNYRSDGIGAPMAAGLEPAQHPDVGLVLPVNLRIPTSEKSPLVFAIDRGNGARPDLKVQITLNAKSGEIERWNNIKSLLG